MKRYITSIILLISAASLAQNEQDALRYSFIQGGGTARYMGMGGAFGAIGADMSAVSTNPAGLGRYSKSEFVFTPGLNLMENKSTYNGNSILTSKSTFNFTNIGYVGTMVNDKPDMSSWKTVQFGIVYNKLNNYNFDTKIQGNSPSSITHMMANRANGYSFDDNIFGDPFMSGLFLSGELIYEDENEPGKYYSYVETDVEQTKSVSRRGQLGETAISLSGNYDDMLYVGGTIGIQNIKYTEVSTHYEKVLDQSQSLIKDLTYDQTLAIKGTGFNLKLGAIYLPIDWLRIGVAYHTRTIISLEDNYVANLSSNDTIFAEPLAVSSPQGSYEYRIKTPSKTILSAAVILNKRFIISIDEEIADLSNSVLKATDWDYKVENDIIQNVLKPVNTFRIGTEFLVNERFAVRGGFAHFSSPIKKEFVNIKPSRQTVSFGLGYRVNKFFWDVALSVTTWKEDYYLYDPNLIDPAETKYSQIQFLNTFGFRF